MPLNHVNDGNSDPTVP